MKINYSIYYAVVTIISAFLISFGIDYYYHAGIVYKVSVSSNGHYAITTDLKGYAILWNLQQHTKKIIAHHANLYSAYFIKNSDYFIWQNFKNNNVYAANTQGKIIMLIPHSFPSYGQVMSSDLSTYIASDINWNILLTRLQSGHKFTTVVLKTDEDGFLDSGKLTTLTLSADDRYLLTAGDGTEADYRPLYSTDNNSSVPLLQGTVLWDINKQKPIQKFPGLLGKCYATLCLDSKCILAGDENGHGFFESIDSDKSQPLPLINLRDIHNPAIFPDNFRDFNPTSINAILAFKFISDTLYLRFTTYVPYAILYQLGDVRPQKYLFLGHRPLPSVSDYSRADAIDTSSRVHLLVMGKESGNGILVYRFSPKQQTLEKVWDGV